MTNDQLNDLRDDFPVIDIESFMSREFEASGVESEEVHDGGVDIGDIMRVFGGVEADFVGGAMYDAAANASTGHPD